MQGISKTGLMVIAILFLLLILAWVLILTGNFPALVSLMPASTESPLPTATPLPTSTPGNTSTPENTSTPTAIPTETPTPLPPFPTPWVVESQPERPLRLAYMSGAPGDWDIFVADADGSNPINISNDPGFDLLPAWSAQSGLLAWATDRFGEGIDIVTADIEGKGLVNVSNAPDTDDFSIQWSPNGQLLAFLSTRFGDAEVFVATPDGETLFNLSNHEADDVLFDWSPACADLATGDDWADCRLLIGSDRGNSTQDLVVYSLSPDGAVFEFAVNAEFSALEAAFSPDGSQLAYLSADASKTQVDIYLLDLESGESTQLTDTPEAERAIAWSPTGEAIAYLSDEDGDSDIYAVTVADGAIANLTDTDAGEGLNDDFDWSPDGSRILFSTDRDGNPDIYVMDADGGNQTNLTNSSGPELEPIWIW